MSSDTEHLIERLLRQAHQLADEALEIIQQGEVPELDPILELLVQCEQAHAQQDQSTRQNAHALLEGVKSKLNTVVSGLETITQQVQVEQAAIPKNTRNLKIYASNAHKLKYGA